MGLLDILNGMQGGQGYQPQAGGGARMSPMTMALLGLLAYKALRSNGGLGSILGGGQANPGAGAGPPTSGSAGGGGLGNILGGLFGGRPGGAGAGGNLGGLLGGLLGGGGVGGILSGGLGNLINDLQNNGQGQVAKSWVANGPNQEISPERLEAAVGDDTLDALAKQTGMGRDELLSGLSQHLPDLVNHLTPDGRLPTEEEAARMV